MSTTRATEQQIHEALMEWCAAKGIADRVLHYPAEGKRTKSFGARLKRMGMQKGVADLQLLGAQQGYIGGWVELKSRHGVLSAHQCAFLNRMKELRYFTHVTYGLDEAMQSLEWYFFEENENE